MSIKQQQETEKINNNYPNKEHENTGIRCGLLTQTYNVRITTKYTGQSTTQKRETRLKSVAAKERRARKGQNGDIEKRT